MIRYLQGSNGTILTLTDARGIELADAGEERMEPVPGRRSEWSAWTIISRLYAEQAAKKVREEKQADLCVDSGAESPERRNLRQCQCTGV